LRGYDCWKEEWGSTGKVKLLCVRTVRKKELNMISGGGGWVGSICLITKDKSVPEPGGGGGGGKL